MSGATSHGQAPLNHTGSASSAAAATPWRRRRAAGGPLQRAHRDRDRKPPAVPALLEHEHGGSREHEHGVAAQPVGQVVPGMGQERVEVEEGHHGRRQGEDRDEDEDHARVRPVGLAQRDHAQDQGVRVHHGQQPRARVGDDRPREPLLAAGGEHEAHDGGGGVHEEEQLDELHPRALARSQPCSDSHHQPNQDALGAGLFPDDVRMRTLAPRGPGVQVRGYPG